MRYYFQLIPSLHDYVYLVLALSLKVFKMVSLNHVPTLANTLLVSIDSYQHDSLAVFGFLRHQLVVETLQLLALLQHPIVQSFNKTKTTTSIL